MNDGLNPNGLSSRLELSVNRPRASAAFHLTLLEGMRGFERVEDILGEQAMCLREGREWQIL